MKTPFSTVIFSDECKATLAESHDWDKYWECHGNNQIKQHRKEQRRGGVIHG